ncbi:hypothetical protein [Spirulina subsalsa]|uniref:hypothetical protein n=1 Tax=Spirulina subsalsa TaxID=54311 RepID=UPI0003017894|nr:hypothetical protein [Spirulina subsalsa]
MDSQPPINPLLYAPNLHLFAFHLWRGLTGETDSLVSNPHQLWQKGDEILKRLGFHERLHLYGYPEASPEPPGAYVNLHPQTCLKLAGRLPYSDLKITGRVLTYRLYDSYSLTINLRRPEQEYQQKTPEVPLTFWRNLNTEEQIFLPDFVQSSLGQTLLLTAFLPATETNQKAQDLQEFARRCLEQLMPSRKIKRPPLYHWGEVFGSPIFQFGGQVLDANLVEEAEIQPHILVLLWRDELASAKFVDAYERFINLFYYRNKVLAAYSETRTLYRKTYQAYTDLEKKVKNFKGLLSQKSSGQQLSEGELRELKSVLKELAVLDLEYARLLRNYKHCRNTISINTKNYLVTLGEIVNTLQEQGYDLQGGELDFFQEFGTRTSPYFQTRIGDELNYFVEGSSLADKAIASLRGIVEIEQTQRDRTLQEQNEKLQDKIQALGVGIATGAIIASTSALIWQDPVSCPWSKTPVQSCHPFILAVGVSLVFAVAAWWGAKCLIGYNRQRGQGG